MTRLTLARGRVVVKAPPGPQTPGLWPCVGAGSRLKHGPGCTSPVTPTEGPAGCSNGVCVVVCGGRAAEGIRLWKLVCKVESLGIMWDQNLLPVPQAWPCMKGRVAWVFSGSSVGFVLLGSCLVLLGGPS